MHPLAHTLTGALVGQLAPSPVAAVVGGIISHLVLDAIPHTEGKTFSPDSAPRHAASAKAARARSGVHLGAGGRALKLGFGVSVGADVVEAGLEFLAGAAALGWFAGSCPELRSASVVLGAMAAIAPDFVDTLVAALFGINLLHIERLHWTATRRHAVLGVLTQIVVAGTVALLLWRAAGCG